MLGTKGYYSALWKGKQSGELAPMRNRDWFHRVLLDPLFDPLQNPRHSVAVRMLERGQRLLDVGCWDGRLLDQVRASGLYSELHGVDLPPEAIEAVRSKGYEGHVVDLNAEALPYPESFFNAVTLLAVLEHVFDPSALVREVWRVLRPGGLFVLDVPNVASFSNRVRILFGALPVTSTDPGWDGGHLHYFTRRALDRFLQSEGFEVVQRKCTGAHPELREWWLSLLGGELIYLCRKRASLPLLA